MATLAHIVALLLVNLQYHDTTHTCHLPCCRLGYKTQAIAFVLGADKGFLFPLSVSSLLWSPCINHPLMRLQLMIELLIKDQTCGERKQSMWERKVRSAKQQIETENKVKSWCKLERRRKGWQTIKGKKERVNRQKDGRSVRIETANRRTREERGREGKKRKKEMAESCQWAIRGSVSPADIVSMLLTSKGSDYEESKGLQTMGGEENNIKVSRTFESG